MQKAIVIGSGIGGIACALRLQKKGYAVTVFEANDTLGGKMGSLSKVGFRWDTGPSLFTMPHFVDELFELFSLNPRDYFNYKQKENICTYFWEDGTTFSASANLNKFIQEAAHTFNEPRIQLQKYLTKSKKKYELTAPIFLEQSLHKYATYFSFKTLNALLKSYQLQINQSLNDVNHHCFSDARLVQLFNRYATYNGSSPYQTPGIMSMIPHLEMHYGTYFPEGGMYAIVHSLYHLALKVGVQFKLNEPVIKINHQNKKVSNIQTTKAEYKADIIISNMDIYATYQHLLKDTKQPHRSLQQERSSSALIFYWGINTTFEQLDLHNIFFSDAYQEEFNCIFAQRTLSNDPTVYINISSKDKRDDAPTGCENWFVMINAPGNYGQDWDELKQEAKKNIIHKLNRLLDIDLEKLILTEEILDPVKIEANTSSYRGALYGAASNSKFAAFLRHPNFSSHIKNLYFCGGSVHPGGGIPLCLLSAKIVSNLIQNA